MNINLLHFKTLPEVKDEDYEYLKVDLCNEWRRLIK